MLDTLRPVFVAALTALIIGGLAWLLRRSKPLVVSGEGGTIRPERWSAWFTVVVGALMFLLGAFLFFSKGEWTAALIALLGLAIGGFMAPSVTSVHSVHWNADGIEGPSKMFGPTLGLARTAIKWSDIVSTGKTVTGYWFVEAGDSRRVYWSYLYSGYGALTRAIQTHCPSLVLPADLS